MAGPRLLLAALTLTLSAAPALARDVLIDVDARSGPWDAKLNAEKMPYGIGDALPPTVIPFDIAAGKIGVFAEGTTDAGGKTGIGPSGIDSDIVDDKTEKKKRYPSFYTPKVLYPVARHAIVAVFLDEQGKVVSRPVAVGTDGVALPIPDGATAIALGFNDVTFQANSGKLKVTVQIPD